MYNHYEYRITQVYFKSRWIIWETFGKRGYHRIRAQTQSYHVKKESRVRYHVL